MKLAQSLLNFFEENGIVEYTILKKYGKIQVEFEAEDVDIYKEPYNSFGNISGMIPQRPNDTEIKEEEPQTETVVSEEPKNDTPTEVPVEEKHETYVEPDTPKKEKHSNVNPSRIGKIQDVNNPEFYKQRSIPNLSIDPNLDQYIKEAIENGINPTCRKYGLASSSLGYHVNKYKKKMKEEAAKEEVVETEPEVVEEVTKKVEDTSKEVEKFSDDSKLTNDITLYKDHNFSEEELKYIKLYLKRKIKPAEAAKFLGIPTKDFNLLASQYTRAKNITGDKKNPPAKKEVEEPKFNRVNLPDGWHMLPDDGMFHEIKNGVVVK